MEALYSIKLPNSDYIQFVEDIVRMLAIQMTIQFLYFINSNGEVSFFALDFLLLSIYIVLGVCVYWLIIKKLVVFK